MKIVLALVLLAHVVAVLAMAFFPLSVIRSENDEINAAPDGPAEE